MCRLNVFILYPRVEYLRHFEENAKKHDVIVFEGVESETFIKFLKGEVDINEYLMELEVDFPLFTYHLYMLAKKLHDCGFEVMVIDPYQSISQEVRYMLITNKVQELIDKRDPTIHYVIKLESSIKRILEKYHKALRERDFDKLVKLTIEYAKADAHRVKFRCILRAKKISEFFKLSNKKVIIQTHPFNEIIKDYLKNMMNCEVKYVSVIDIVSRELKIEIPPHPGVELTLSYVYGRKLSFEEEKLLAARSLLYVLLTPRTEYEPRPDNPYPYLKRELEVLKLIYSLSYDECRDRYYRIFKK